MIPLPMIPLVYFTSTRKFMGDFVNRRRTRIVLNLGQVSKNLKGGEVIAVPGKVLGSGEPKEKLTIAAFKFSPRALVKVEKAGGRCIPFSRLVEENPRGTNVRLLR